MSRKSVYAAPFISLEGGEGAGKTTQSLRLKQRLESINKPALVVQEPGTTQLGMQVRRLIKQSNSSNVPAADALLFMAARAQLMHEIVLPKLKAGVIVIGDRFTDSTIAYQGYGGNLDIDRIRRANELATDGVVPDLTIFLKLSPQTGLARRALADERSGERQRRFEELPRKFHSNVFRGYQQMAQHEPNRWVDVDASRSVDEVAEAVWRHVCEFEFFQHTV